MEGQITPAAAAREILRRRALRADFTAYCAEALRPVGFVPAAHHRYLNARLEDVAAGRIRKLMVNMPPGSAKSTYGSILFPTWFQAQRPNLNVLATSHTMKLALRFSGQVQRIATDNARVLGYDLATEGVNGWTITNGGSYLPAGVDSKIAGFRADLGIIDDPVGSRGEAESAVIRQGAWDWYLSDFYPRLKPNAGQIVIMTRYHEDDLGGRLLAADPDGWTVVKIAAMAGEDDPLGRAPGEFLWDDEKYPYGSKLREALEVYERSGGMRDWESLYQQNPRPGTGALFKAGMFGTVDAAPVGGTLVRAWDLAATKQIGTANPDWTVGTLMQRTPADRYVVREVIRFRGGPEEVEHTIMSTAARDGRAVKISIPKDPGQAGKVQASIYVKRLAGHEIETTPETGDKATRAAPFAAQVNAGNVDLVRAPWNAAFIDEFSAFPAGTKDDQVDACSRAFGVLAPVDDVMKRFQALV